MRKLLIVDDKIEIRTLMQAELKDEGYDVHVAAGGREALDYLKTIDYDVDLVLLDIKMPDISGLDVLKEIKDLRSSLPVLLLSAYSTYKQDFKSWAAEDYVVKSSDLTELKQKIARIVSTC